MSAASPTQSGRTGHDMSKSLADPTRFERATFAFGVLGGQPELILKPRILWGQWSIDPVENGVKCLLCVG